MRTKLSVTIILVVGLALVGTWTASAQGSEPLTLNINLGTGDPPTLDPALATDTTSVTVIEQLFIGLVDLDDDTAEVRPELATSWTVSPDGTVYTFTLRSDVYWTDGRPVTAGDVRYGILRTLNPATQSDYAYPLFVIKNAEGYNSGAITDPNQVGVTALDDTHLRITLEYPASYALSILSMWVARPMPQWAIDRWGSAWTDPAHIVTNGPYRLTEWVHDDHILLDRNPTYYDAVNVQIERVKMWMVDESTAWTMYLNGQLDTAGIPAGHMGDVPPQEVHIQPIACTSYYGFSVSQAPFDNPLVRKAFAAATDRQGLVNTLFGGTQRPALTFTPPGVFGHVDGYAEGVGIPYNPTQARQWLADAGYPNGQGLPPITLWFNTSTGHQLSPSTSATTGTPPWA
jgi:oligopeptide transport system substrate-binding protein